MNILDFQKFLPKTLEKISSPINSEISVIEHFGKRKIMACGLTQSGPMAEEIWESALRLLTKFFAVQKGQFVSSARVNESESFHILILGLGGGSLAKLINHYFPKAKITGIEIDPIMIYLGKKYLDLEKAKNLEIKIMDAEKYVNKRAQEILKQVQNDKNKFDLVFADMYLGDKTPKFLENKLFLENLKRILTENGIVVFNRLYYKNHIFEARIFLDKLEEIFDDLHCKKIYSNLLVYCK